jgi:hypothetical protein
MVMARTTLRAAAGCSACCRAGSGVVKNQYPTSPVMVGTRLNMDARTLSHSGEVTFIAESPTAPRTSITY